MTGLYRYAIVRRWLRRALESAGEGRPWQAREEVSDAMRHWECLTRCRTPAITRAEVSFLAPALVRAHAAIAAADRRATRCDPTALWHVNPRHW